MITALILIGYFGVIGLPCGFKVARSAQKDLGIPRNVGENSSEYCLLGFFFVLGMCAWPIVVLLALLVGLGKSVAKR